MKPTSIVVQKDATAPLDRWLADELSARIGRAVPRSSVRKGIVNGFVTVGGSLTRDPGLMVRRGPSVFVRSFDWLPPVNSPTGDQLVVLFEDEWLIAADKPAGLPTHETRDAARPSLTALVEQHLGRRAYVHHRLDAATSGVVLFAKSEAANAGLAQAFADREAHKTYVAIVLRPPVDWPSDMTIETPIIVGANGAVRVGSAGVAAITKIKVLQRRPNALLIQAAPITGRKHQIRVHLASVGAPVLGDERYAEGKSKIRAPRLMLHAERLELRHPISGSALRIESPRPPAFRNYLDAERLASAQEPTRGRPPSADRSQSSPSQSGGQGDGSRPAKSARTGGMPPKRLTARKRGSRR